MPDDNKIDYDSAELFLRRAREAEQSGDAIQCLAARRLVGVALRITEPNGARIHTAHLKAG